MRRLENPDVSAERQNGWDFIMLIREVGPRTCTFPNACRTNPCLRSQVLKLYCLPFIFVQKEADFRLTDNQVAKTLDPNLPQWNTPSSLTSQFVSTLGASPNHHPYRHHPRSRTRFRLQQCRCYPAAPLSMSPIYLCRRKLSSQQRIK